MTERQVDYLKQVVTLHPRLVAYWLQPPQWWRITAVTTHPEEPGPVAVLAHDGLGVKYVALDNVNTDEITIVTGDLAVWPD